MSPRIRAILQALLVTFLWSTSWVFIKVGLNEVEIPALTFAGLRYCVAFLCLLLYGRYTGRLRSFRTLTGHDWLLLGALGIVFYSVTQGTQFLALVYLPSVTLSLLLNFTTVVVALMGIVWLKEYPTGQQWGGMTLFLLGVLIFFYPIAFPAEIALGLFIGGISTLANAGASVLGRYVNRTAATPAFIVTLVSMGIGSFTLLGVGITTQGFPAIPVEGWAIILWLALVNTAFAFTLWNLTLQTLSAVESSIINNTMLIQIALLAWIFLDERVTLREGAGMALAAVGIVIVQIRRHSTG